MTRYAIPQLVKTATRQELSLIADSGRALLSSLAEIKPKSHRLQEQQQGLSAKILDRTTVKFFKMHPSWRASLFDEHFMKSWAVPLVDNWQKSEGFPEPEVMARTWSEQLWLRKDKRERLIKEATPVVADFMKILEGELVAGSGR
jgi:hypothetical protein